GGADAERAEHRDESVAILQRHRSQAGRHDDDGAGRQTIEAIDDIDRVRTTRHHDRSDQDRERRECQQRIHAPEV
nr:hypothetical protein [Tanacetum cinerariifolium]